MGFSISGLLNDVGIKLPSLSNIGSTIVNEGKQLLGEVVKDSFTLSNQPGQVFDSNMNLNVLGDNIRMSNPIGSLANKLLGAADGELNKFGVNVDFKTVLSKLFHLPTESGTVSVPPITTRGGSLPASPAAAVAAASAPASTAVAGVGGGGGAVSVHADTAAPSAPFGMSNGIDSTLSSALNAAGSQFSTAEGDMSKAEGETGQQQLVDMQKASNEMQMANELFQMVSQILQDNHQTRMAIIQNMK